MQCRFLTLEGRMLERALLSQGKYEEEKERDSGNQGGQLSIYQNLGGAEGDLLILSCQAAPSVLQMLIFHWFKNPSR